MVVARVKGFEASAQQACEVRMVHLERVARARAEAVAENELERLARTFKILGDPTRLKIIMALQGGEMCVCDIAAFVGLSESAVSHQLRRLRDWFLVRSRRDGQVLYYRLDDLCVQDLIIVGRRNLEKDSDKRSTL